MSENIKAITDFIFIENNIDEITESKLVVVLCNNSIDDLAFKIDRLFKDGKVSHNSKIILSGASGKLDVNLDKECIRLCNELVDNYGYDKSLFILEDKATNIYENLLYSKQYIESFDGYDNIIMIGAAFALRRIKMCASRLDYPVDKIQFIGTVDDRNISKDDWWKNDLSKLRVYEEIERIGKYLVKGDLDIK